VAAAQMRADALAMVDKVALATDKAAETAKAQKLGAHREVALRRYRLRAGERVLLRGLHAAA
jgi:hypothetical protein